MKVAIIGGNGMLGTELMKVFPGAGNLNHGVLRIEGSPNNWPLDVFSSGLIINTAAFHEVGECEKFPNRAFEVNYIGVRNLARVCKSYCIRLIHISTNMVFNGRKWTAYDPTDDPDPQSVYGYSKWLGECAIRDEITNCDLKATIVRLGPIYGHAPCRGKNGRQFVSDLLAKAQAGKPLAYPCDQIVSPISCADAAEAIRSLVDMEDRPVVHVGSENSCSWFEFAREILRQAVIDRPIETTLTTDPKRPKMGALRPSLKTPRWQDSLAGYFSSRPVGA